MQIAIEARYLAGNRLGVGRYLYNLLRFLPDVNKQNDFFLYSDGRQLDQSIKHDRIHYVNLKGPKKIIWRHLMLPVEQYKKKHDILFLPSYSAPILKLGKTIVTIHDVIPLIYPEWSVKRERVRFATAIRYTTPKIDKIIAVSESTRRDIIESTKVDPDKIVVIYEGVDEQFKILSNEQLEDFKNSHNLFYPFILYVGAIHPRRNIKRLIEAFSLLKKEKKIDHKLVLIGMTFHNHLQIQLDNWIKESKVENEIIRINYVSNEDLIKFYNCAELFIYPSIYEGFGLPVLEAMACGTPVITSNNSSLVEVAGDSGLLIDPEDVDNIFEALNNVISDRELQNKLSTLGLKRCKQFSWRQAAQETINLFERVSCK